MAYTVRSKDNAGDLGRAADQNASVDNDVYFKAYCPQLIEIQTFAGAAADVTFSAIAAGWRNLMVVGYCRTSRAATSDEVCLQFNADTGANYDWVYDDLRHSNARVTYEGVAAAYIDVGSVPGDSAVAGAWGTFDILIPAYANTVGHKTVEMRSVKKQAASSTNLIFAHGAGWWRSTNAITSIKIYPATGPNWVIGSIFCLYGM